MLDDYNTITIPMTVSQMHLNELRSNKRNNLDELINIPTKAKERSDPNFV